VFETGGIVFARLVQTTGPTHSYGVLGRIPCRRHKPFEFAMARAQTPDQYVQALRRFHISAALMIGSMDAHSSSTVSIVVSDTGSAFIAGAGDDGALCDLSDRAGLIRT
jgi:hypothetical protein